jgi:hypothetical protein
MPLVNTQYDNSNIYVKFQQTYSDFGLGFLTFYFYLFWYCFSSTVEEIDIISKTVFKFHRYDGIRDITQKTVIPPPLVVIEYLYYFVKFLKRYATGVVDEKESIWSL